MPPIKITDEILEQAGNNVANDKTYGKESDLIKECFQAYPKNDDKKIIALKCGLIDITNSTNISRYKSKISVVEIVEILLTTPNLDERIEKGDHNLITDISSRTKNENDINLFSFATKFCCYHNIFVYGKDDFAIYDSVIKDHLPEYTTGVSKYKIDNLRKKHDYQGYLRIIDKILIDNDIKIPGKRRKLDNLIWFTNR